MIKKFIFTFTTLFIFNITPQMVKADAIDPSANQVQQTTTNTSNDNITHKKVVKPITRKRNKIINLAKKEVGKPYVYGATGPYAFDCSGLVQYVYSHAAKTNLPRTTYTQVYSGRKVSLRHLQKGDLLFWGSKNAPYHVGIYVGNGQYVHAATPSQGVIKQSLSPYFYPSQAKRIL